MDLLSAAVDKTKSKIPNHWEGIVDRTGRGSFWTVTPNAVEALIRAAEPCEVSSPIPGVAYFKITSDEVIGHEDIEVLDRFAQDTFVRMGVHGPELCILSDAESTPVNFAHVIVGPDDDFATSNDIVIWSAFPGRIPPNKADEALLKTVWERAVQKVALFPDELRRFEGCAAKRVKS